MLLLYRLQTGLSCRLVSLPPSSCDILPTNLSPPVAFKRLRHNWLSLFLSRLWDVSFSAFSLFLFFIAYDTVATASWISHSFVSFICFLLFTTRTPWGPHSRPDWLTDSEGLCAILTLTLNLLVTNSHMGA